MGRSIEAWVMTLSQDNLDWCYFDTRELIGLHNELHAQFGDSPNDAIIPGEQRLSERLRGWGIEHRYDDALSKAAGTYQEDPMDPTLEEFRAYLEKEITLISGAVSLVQTAGGEGPIYLKFEDGVFNDSTTKSIMKMLNKWLPSSMQLKKLPSASQKDEFATVAPIYALELDPRYGRREVTLWANLTKKMRDSAADASKVFKRDENPKVQINVVKQESSDITINGFNDWLFVLGEVLIPEEPDRTKTEDSDADVYDEVEVRKACHWFAANSQEFEYMHENCGGYPLDSTEIVMVENTWVREATTIEKSEVKAATWLMGAYVRGQVRADVEAGKLNSWSISADAMASFEEAQA
jgi:DNA gyrase inhibitor GyrI